MMLGGGIMLFLGLLMMLLLVGLPLLLIVTVIAGVWGIPGRRDRSSDSTPVYYQPAAPSVKIVRAYSHCGQELQAAWTHCPYCGAPA